MRLLKVHKHFFCFVNIWGKIVVCPPRGQTAHLPPVVGLVSVSDETNNCIVFCKLNEEVCAVPWSAVIGQQSGEEGAVRKSISQLHSDVLSP